MRVASHPPRGAVRARLTHTALTLDGWRHRTCGFRLLRPDCRWRAVGHEVSRFSCMQFHGVPGVWNYVVPPTSSARVDTLVAHQYARLNRYTSRHRARGRMDSESRTPIISQSYTQCIPANRKRNPRHPPFRFAGKLKACRRCWKRLWKKLGLCLAMSRMRSHRKSSLLSPTRTPGRSVSSRSVRLSVAWLGRHSRKTQGVRPFRWTRCFDPVADDPAVPAFVLRFAFGCSAGSQARVSPLPDQPGAPWAAFQETRGRGRGRARTTSIQHASVQHASGSTTAHWRS